MNGVVQRLDYNKVMDNPYQLNGVVQRLDYNKVMDKFIMQPSVYNKDKNYGQEDFFNFGNITYNGSFGGPFLLGTHRTPW
ncbi:MAG: hypothetical protein WDM78_02395 [Puia sp.]